MLTLKKLEEMQLGTVIDSGITEDSSQGVNMANTGQPLKWIAVRDIIYDWAIYIGPSMWSLDYVRIAGDKVCNLDNVRKLVPCDDEALQMYRK